MSTQTEHAQPPSVVKVVEMVGESRVSWEDAARMLVSRESQPNRHITGLDLIRSTAVVKDGRITEYHVAANLAFVEEPSIILR
jgi:flavin-binding protein dodecin